MGGKCEVYVAKKIDFRHNQYFYVNSEAFTTITLKILKSK